MTKLEKQWFKTLTKDRSESADTLDKPSMRGIQRSVVDKYSDQAHFIYELLQNADDVKAKSVKFNLTETGLYFIHNGSVGFTVSDPKNEDADSIKGTLGHINAITSIANSNKTAASIGKFGVGFKAVFQYTQTPHIYDPEIRFKIERFIVPILLDIDLDWRDPSETVFFFPFDHKNKSPHESYNEILGKLNSLEFPTLFLSSLESISFNAKEFNGKYTKETSKYVIFGDITSQWINLKFIINQDEVTQRMLVFSRGNTIKYPYSIGYALSKTGDLIPITQKAFCFFPTKETTNLNFIIHAPFLLTDSREGIKAGENHNHEMIRILAQLAADSLPILRDEKLINDGIFNIIPCDESKFSESNDKRNISFKPFFSSISDKFHNDTLLPAINGLCSSRDQSYWASDADLVKLITDKQLTQLTGTENAHWIFRSRGWKEIRHTNKSLANYIDGGDVHKSIDKKSNKIIASLDPDAIFKKITADFISAQSVQWLHSLYIYLSERFSYQNLVKEKPIFLDRNNNAVSAFDENKQLTLFLPDDEIDGYTTIKKELLLIKTTRDFVERFGIKKPTLRDEIYNKILPAYSSKKEIVTSLHFKKFFRYFNECRNAEITEFIDLIKDKKFLRYTTVGNKNIFRGNAVDIYLPKPELLVWFKNKPTTKFLLLNEYQELVGEENLGQLMKFLLQLGISQIPRVLDVDVGKWGSNKEIDGLNELLANIDKEMSIVLWKVLTTSWSIYEHSMQISKNGYSIRGSKAGNKVYDTHAKEQLHRNEWILNKAGNLVYPSNATIQSLSEQYDTSSFGGKSLISFLQIYDQTKSTAHLSEIEARKNRLVDEIERSGLSEDEVRVAIDDAKRRKSIPLIVKDIDDSKQNSLSSILISELEKRRTSTNSLKSAVRHTGDATSVTQSIDVTEDNDYYMPKVVNYSKKLDAAKERYSSELDRIEREQVLHDKANRLPRYSYGWFLALLELECMSCSEKNSDGKSISINFGKVVQDSQSNRIIILKEPNRFIPPYIEELSDVRVDLDFGNGKSKKLQIESFTAREFSLIGKLSSNSDLTSIDFNGVLKAYIEVQNPSFLLRELLKRFRELNLAELFNMKSNLKANIEFVFGPPGTGKTTYLAEKILIPMMRRPDPVKVLVLTPTNKSADVLTSRIIEKMGSDASYLNWLVRFGTSSDEQIEKIGVRRDRAFNLSSLNKSITVTTISRFAYDGFTVEYGSKKLFEIEWDFIVIDEASMISLSSIIYPLQQQNPQKFIIAGDPFQIEPIVALEQWKDENIYTLVGLDKMGSFAKPTTEPKNYLVTNLRTQYRSIPAIGEVCSLFTYDGILKHDRARETQRPLKINGYNIQPLNIIKFPVSKYESIYRAKRLESGTPYQTYSALFTFEFVRWLTQQIQINNNEKFRIGVIAPYRAQANILSQLNNSWDNKQNNIEIQVGTIHGFQGDECDIVIAVLNPPPIITSNPKMFLNKQNILNVAISRARDYLFIIMPDANSAGVENLYNITQIERLVKLSDSFSEFASHAIEEMIWGNENYLEENTFSTGHQMVNVYRKPNRYYEIRSDESAVDIQIHEN